MHGSTEFFDVKAHRLAEKVRDARLVVCISHFTRSQLMGLSDPAEWDKLHMVHCGVDPAVFSPARARTHGDPDTLEILTVGRLVPVKGQEVLLAAVSRLVAAGTRVALTFVGDGPSRGRLERAARELGIDVRFVGAVGQDEIREHYAQADVFALPSFAEGVPVVLMEAMAMEVPVVTSRITGIPELVEDGVTGLLTAPGDEDGLATALARLAADPAERRRLGAAGREKVEREFDIEDVAVQLRRIFAEGLPAD
jgi:glycosyltransferase involved in cell wall biosynthesis